MKSIYRIALLEFDKHWDCADGFSRLIYGSPHELTIFCDRYIHNCLSEFKHNEKVSFIIKPDSESIASFLTNNLEAFKSLDLIFIDTIHTNPKDFLSLPFEGMVVLRVHNAFKQFAPEEHIWIPFSYFYIRKAIPYFIRELILNRFLFYTRKLNSKINYFTFLSESITEFVTKQKLVPAEKTVFTLPMAPWQKIDHEKPQNKLIISIVGSPDRRRKNYQPIIESLKTLFNKDSTYPLPVELYLLGNSSGKYGLKISTAFNALNSKSFKCFHFNKEVPIKKFDAILKDTHIILSPLQVFNITQIYGEIYGKTKFTASIGTIIKYNLIGLFPSSFEFDRLFDPHLIKYNDSKELSASLHHLLSQPYTIFEKLTALNTFLSTHYEKERMLHSLESIIAISKLQE